MSRIPTDGGDAKELGRITGLLGKEDKRELMMRAAANEIPYIEIIKHGLKIVKKYYPLQGKALQGKTLRSKELHSKPSKRDTVNA
jgi:hypothetical protein